MKRVLKVPLEEASFEQVWATLPPPEANNLSLQAFNEPVILDLPVLSGALADSCPGSQCHSV